ncbi:MAG: phosphotransferase [Gammaproteobacteria bacterium]|nr:phosphotransferase [Gammaproteobacteria bacterium]
MSSGGVRIQGAAGLYANPFIGWSISLEDAALSGLAEALDGELMRARLQARLRLRLGGGWSVTRCAIVRWRHRPGTRASIQYRLDVNDGGTRHWHGLMASGSLFSGGKARRLEKTLQPRTVGPDALLPGRALAALYEPETRLLWQFFPFDRALPNLKAVIAQALPLREQLLAPTFGDAVVELRPVRFRPGIGCTLHARDAAGRGLYIKVYPPGQAAGAFDRFRTLCRAWSGSIAADGPTAIGPRWCCDALDALASPVAEGVVLTDLAPAGPAAPRSAVGRQQSLAAPAAQVADALLGLHRSDLRGLQRRPADQVVASARQAAERIARVLPDQAQPLRDLLHALRPLATPGPVVPTHGDLKPEHVFIRAGQVQLIDLDDAVLAEPLQDLAMLVSRLDGIMIEHADAYAGHGGPARVDGAAQAGLSELRDTLLARYLERMPDAWSARRLALHRVSALLLVALHFVQHLKPDWPLLVDRVLRHAWTLLRE